MDIVRNTTMRLNGGEDAKATMYGYPIRKRVNYNNNNQCVEKNNRVLACALQCLVHISTMSVRAWRTCIHEFHSPEPLTFDFLLCAPHLFCRNRR